GFGGAALGLPLMLLIYNQPLFWLPIIGTHLLFFSALTLRTRISNVDWAYLRQSLIYILPAALIGVFGLLNLPNRWLLLFIYVITLFYAVIWLFNIDIRSNKNWVDKCLLIAGGYVAGTSLTGAPLMVAVFMRHIAITQLRNTLFVLWFILVSIKMTTFAVVGVDLHITTALMLLPVATIGHVMGIYAHDKIMQNDRLFRRIIGGFLIAICLPGLWQAY
ncbi:MAG TPA: sulfite exporter TauE/SafE family protein, partial [Gammaproteobacteria bacterium]|nr:sulfite exporter TauE/SafE family protein [Gammaproteobacteria bacterium]